MKSDLDTLVDVFDAVAARQGKRSAIEAVLAADRALRSRRKLVKASTIPDAARVIVLRVAQLHGVPVSHVIDPARRGRWLAAVRQEAAWLLHRRVGLSLHQIGRALERDHTTVLYAVRAFERRLATDEVLARRIADLTPASRAA